MRRSAPISAALTTTLTLAEVIDHHAAHNAELTFAFFPAADPADEPERVTYLEYGRATQRFARAVCAGGDVPVKCGEVVGILANVDSLLYMAAVGGLIRAGLTPFPISPRNSAPAVCDMLRKVGAHRLLITSASAGALASAVRDALAEEDHGLTLEECPALGTVFPLLGRESASDEFEPLPIPARDVYLNDTQLILHSSGSTGFPKPITWTTAFVQALTYSDFLVDVQDSGLDLDVSAPGVPPFHAMGIWFQFLQPILCGQAGAVFRPAHPAPPVMATPSTTLVALRAIRAKGMITVPTFLEIWVHDPVAVAYLASLEFIGFGGGPLAREVGDALARAGCTLRNMYGGTEIGMPTRYFRNLACAVPAREDWMWVTMAPHVHARWVPHGRAGDDGEAMEFQVLAHDRHVLAVENLPDVRGYSTQDLLVAHPSKPGLWRIIGRADDVIVLANGEKIVPGPTEGAVIAHPAVSGAVMFGRERNQPGILVEPAEARAFDPADEAALAAFRNEIWPAVEEANRTQPAFAKLFKEMILVARQDAPLPRVAKGSVTRGAALALYDADIRALYHTVEHPAKGGGVPLPDLWTEPEVARWLLEVASAVRDGAQVDPTLDLFAQGFDSLSATFLRNHVLGALRAADPAHAARATGAVGNAFVYAHPTVQAMAGALVALVGSGANGHAGPNSAVEAAEALVEKYSANMPDMAKEVAESAVNTHVVVLTGSTGGLGSHLLAGLLTDDHVAKVYALNRPSQTPSMERHEGVFRDRGLKVDLLASPKLVFVEADASEERLGLSAERYEEISASVTTVIHNAWRLDFNLGLASFEPNVRATRRLLDLALTSAHAPTTRVIFTSSVGVTRSWPRERGPYPEEPQADARWCLGGGYGEAKWVAERLLVAAGARGLHATSLRIGQIAGSVATGAWATTDWVPILLKSGVAVGCLPDAEGYASWMPADPLGQAIIDVALGGQPPAPALNMRHPRPAAWTTFMRGFSQALHETGVTQEPLPLVEFQVWAAKVVAASRGADEAALRRIPAIKILDFFAGLAAADSAFRASGAAGADVEACGMTVTATEKAQAASAAFRDMPVLDEKDAARWLGYWKTKGYFNELA